jgi:hypothetical protein
MRNSLSIIEISILQDLSKHKNFSLIMFAKDCFKDKILRPSHYRELGFSFFFCYIFASESSVVIKNSILGLGQTGSVSIGCESRSDPTIVK